VKEPLEKLGFKVVRSVHDGRLLPAKSEPFSVTGILFLVALLAMIALQFLVR
jgi:hypothetical protein